jgi:hypothetical protein
MEVFVCQIDPEQGIIREIGGVDPPVSHRNIQQADHEKEQFGLLSRPVPIQWPIRRNS